MAVGFGKGKTQSAADIFDRRLGFQGSEGRDLRHPVGAVFVFDVLDHLRPAADAEIDIDIRHRLAFGIEKAFEQQDVADRIEIGDAHRIGDQAARRRAAPWADRNAVLLGVIDEIGDHQKVAGKLHVDDDAEFIIQALSIGLAYFWIGDPFEPLLQPLMCQLNQIVVEADLLGRREVGKMIFAELDFDIAAVGNFDRPFHRVRAEVETLHHLFSGFEIKLDRSRF